MNSTSNNIPKLFAQFYEDRIQKAVTDVAGKDGRLSSKEAKKIDDRCKKTIDSFFDMTGQESVGVKRIIGVTTERALKAAEQALDRNGKINHHRMPGDLAQVYLRFKKTVPKQPGHLSEDKLVDIATAFARHKVAFPEEWTNLRVDEVQTRTEFFYFTTEVADKIGEENLIRVDVTIAHDTDDIGVYVTLDTRNGEIQDIYLERDGPYLPGEV